VPDPLAKPEPLPAPPAGESRQWAMFSHLAVILGAIGIPLGAIIGPLVIMLVKGKEDAAVREHAVEALNFGISVTLVQFAVGVVFGAVAGMGGGFGFGFGFGFGGVVPLVSLAAVILAVVAAVKVNGGEPWRYPVALRLVT